MLRKRHVARSAIKSAIIAHTAKRLHERHQHGRSHRLASSRRVFDELDARPEPKRLEHFAQTVINSPSR
jgi:hypothetical protein